MIRKQDASCEVPAPAGGVPVPPRYWWLKRIIVGVVITLIAVGVVRWRWGVYAQRMLQAEIDSYIAAGQPVYEADFLLPPLPDDQNATVLLTSIRSELEGFRKMIPTWRATGERSNFIKLSEDPEIVQFLVDEAETQAVALRAAQMPAVRWSYDGGSEARDSSNLISLLILRAAFEYRQGNAREAVSLLAHELHWCRKIAMQRTMIASLLSGAGVTQGADLLEEMLPTLNVGSHRADVKGMMEELRDDYLHEGYVLAVYRERAWAISALDLVIEQPSKLFGKKLNPWWGRLIVPMVPLDGVRTLQRATVMADAMAAPDHPTCLKRMPAPMVSPGMNLKGTTRTFSTLTTPNLSRAVEVGWKIIARQRMVALALAVRLYEADHGLFPEDLNALVPEYLPELPRNPFAPEELTFELDAAGQWPCIRAAGLKDPRYNVFYIKGRPSAASKTNPAG